MGIISKYLKQFNRRIPALPEIYLAFNRYVDDDIKDIIDCLILHPNATPSIALSGNLLTDKTGVKLAQYIASSTTIEEMDLYSNQFGEETYMAILKALRINSSIREMSLTSNNIVNWTRVSLYFIDTLRLNSRLIKSCLGLYTCPPYQDNLKRAAKKSASPSMLEFLLCVHSSPEKIEAKIH